MLILWLSDPQLGCLFSQLLPKRRHWWSPALPLLIEAHASHVNCLIQRGGGEGSLQSCNFQRATPFEPKITAWTFLYFEFLKPAYLCFYNLGHQTGNVCIPYLISFGSVKHLSVDLLKIFLHSQTCLPSIKTSKAEGVQRSREGASGCIDQINQSFQPLSMVSNQRQTEVSSNHSFLLPSRLTGQFSSWPGTKSPAHSIDHRFELYEYLPFH